MIKEGFISSEWERMDRLKQIFGIEPIRCFGAHDYMINNKEMLSLDVVYPFKSEYPVYWVEYSKIQSISTFGNDLWIFKQDKGRKYFEPETFDELVECFHQWFRKKDDDEQLGLF